MSDHPVWYVGDRQPSITDTLTVNGVAQNLTGHAVRFRAREVGKSTLLVDQPISNTPDATGVVRYDWSATDVAANGILAAERMCLVWWEDTNAGKTETLGEALIEIRAHAPESNTYIELEEFKSTAELSGTNFANADIRSALVSASRAVDQDCGRRFYLDADATQVRYYDANYGRGRLSIDDLVALTSFQTDYDGDGVYETTWVLNTDFALGPKNASADGKPYTQIQILPRSSYRFPNAAYVPNAVKVTGQYGWLTVPENVKIATVLLAERLVKLMREAPFGIVGLQPDGGVARISRSIPDWDALLSPYRRRRILI